MPQLWYRTHTCGWYCPAGVGYAALLVARGCLLISLLVARKGCMGYLFFGGESRPVIRSWWYRLLRRAPSWRSVMADLSRMIRPSGTPTLFRSAHAQRTAYDTTVIIVHNMHSYSNTYMRVRKANLQRKTSLHPPLLIRVRSARMRKLPNTSQSKRRKTKQLPGMETHIHPTVTEKNVT